jgi:predicted Zn-dependent protease
VGLAYARQGRTDAAILTLGRAAERYPDAPVVYTALGRVWLDAAERSHDQVALSKALEALQPTAIAANASSETLMLYGRALWLSGDATGAERALQQAASRWPVDPMAFRYLADAAERLGHTALAQDALHRYEALTNGT